MNTHLEQNKKNAKAFYDLMLNQCQPAEAIERYVWDTYIQHNPLVGDGKEAVITFSKKSQKTILASELSLDV